MQRVQEDVEAGKALHPEEDQRQKVWQGIILKGLRILSEAEWIQEERKDRSQRLPGENSTLDPTTYAAEQTSGCRGFHPQRRDVLCLTVFKRESAKEPPVWNSREVI
ncbi:hypothetical protein TNCT_220371 [Trichonephila clavata]|uniref:Uncharacterized protein n=1 Tax=Trichonephila clavata TaxID=2740835 RepID=A0A8X6KKW6_TRICU|nr:hypothetical protein TNCT_220371 [Trichonephila clavata]